MRACRISESIYTRFIQCGLESRTLAWRDLEAADVAEGIGGITLLIRLS